MSEKHVHCRVGSSLTLGSIDLAEIEDILHAHVLDVIFRTQHFTYQLSLSFLCYISLILGSMFYHLCVPMVFGATLISTMPTSPSNVPPFMSLPSLAAPQPICVNVTEHPTWGSSPGLFAVQDCVDAMNMVMETVRGQSSAIFDFYSQTFIPSHPLPGSWPLPFGSSKGKSRSCLYWRPVHCLTQEPALS